MSDFFKSGIKYHAKPKIFLFLYIIRMKKGLQIFLGVSDQQYLYSSFLLSTIQQRDYKSRLHLSIKNSIVNEDDRRDNEKVKEGTGKVKQIFDKIYKMSVQGSMPLFEEVHEYVKILKLYSDNIEVQYGGLTATILHIT